MDTFTMTQARTCSLTEAIFDPHCYGKLNSADVSQLLETNLIKAFLKNKQPILVFGWRIERCT